MRAAPKPSTRSWKSPQPIYPLAQMSRLLESTISVAVYPVLVDLTGSVNAALMLSQALYWTRVYLLDHPDRHGWMKKNRQEWQQETGLTRTEQENARKLLRQTDFWQETERGMPAALHYRVDLDRLAQRVNRKVEPTAVDWRNKDAIREFLGKPILVRRRLTDFTNNTNATLLFGHLLQIAATQTGGYANPFPFTIQTLDALSAQTRLTRKELESARRRLREIGFLKELKFNRQAPFNRIEYIINLGAVIGTLKAAGHVDPKEQQLAALGNRGVGQSKNSVGQSAQNPPTGGTGANFGDQPTVGQQVQNLPTGEESARIEGGEQSKIARKRPSAGSYGVFQSLEIAKPANKEIAQQATDDKTCQQANTKPANSKAGLGGSSWQVLGAPIRSKDLLITKTEITTTTAQEREVLQATSVEQAAARSGCSNNLIWPTCFPVGPVRQQAIRILANKPTQQDQALLDEIAGNLTTKKINNPLAYLQRLVNCAVAGEFIPAAGVTVAAARSQAAALSAALQARDEDHRQAVLSSVAVTESSHPFADTLRRIRQNRQGGEHA